MNSEIDGKSLDVKAQKLEQLKELFPEFFSEGKLDFARVEQILGDAELAVQDRYELSWAGKAEARREIQRQTTATLIPNKDGSVDFDTSENIFIEGENLEVLRTLQKAYFGKVKMIYIDPPYNTGNDSFVYPDDFAERLEEYEKRTGTKNGGGFLNKLDLFKKNTKENGQYHSVWLSMMYPRLYLARNLLREDGVIFISIDDNEQANLRLMMDEIFGADNFIANFIWKSKSGGANDSRFVAIDHEYILCYAKNSNNLSFELDLNATVTTSYNLEDENGKYALDRLDKQSIRYSPSGDYEITGPDGKKYTPAHKDVQRPNATWRWGKSTVQERFDELVFKDGSIYTKNYEKDGALPRSLLVEERFGRTRTGKTDFTSLFDAAYFTAPKPVKLINYLAAISTKPNDNDLILDFFAGSSTAAQAVYELNGTDGGNRRFVCVQMPEACDENSDAYKEGYANLADVSRDRIIKAIKQFHDSNEDKKHFDLGFRAYKLYYSNFKRWNSEIANSDELLKQLAIFKEPLANQPTESFDLLTELLLKSGIPLSAKIDKRVTSDDVPFYVIENKAIYALDSLSNALLKDVEEAKPAVFLTLGNLFTGEKADETMTNWKLQLQESNIDFKVI